MQGKVFAYLALFTSMGTLLCCALPALLIALGLSLGTVVALFSAIPGWYTLGAYLNILFLGGGILIGAAFLLIYRAPIKRVCRIPVEKNGQTACEVADHFHRRLLWISLALYAFAVAMDFFITPWLRTHGFFS